MAESEEALQLKRRARRRLVGAIALVTFAVIILPLILDKEPGPAGPPLNVQIPSPESGGFAPGVMPSAPAVPAAPASEKKAEIAPKTSDSQKLAPPKIAVANPAPKSEPKLDTPAPKASGDAEALRARAALNDQAWMVPLEAFSDMKNVKQLRAKLSAAGLKSYTEPVKTAKGTLTRVRAGPFSSTEAAEKARAKLDAMGLKPGAVALR
ncbi:MAG: SPOR domain-containing protein [Burkholderiales bacterium]|nr:SPOR domain-containing protein [Burkholderiales bacterium]